MKVITKRAEDVQIGDVLWLPPHGRWENGECVEMEPETLLPVTAVRRETLRAQPELNTLPDREVVWISSGTSPDPLPIWYPPN